MLPGPGMALWRVGGDAAVLGCSGVLVHLLKYGGLMGLSTRGYMGILITEHASHPHAEALR